MKGFRERVRAWEQVRDESWVQEGGTAPHSGNLAGILMEEQVVTDQGGVCWGLHASMQARSHLVCEHGHQQGRGLCQLLLHPLQVLLVLSLQGQRKRYIKISIVRHFDDAETRRCAQLLVRDDCKPSFCFKSSWASQEQPQRGLQAQLRG